VDGRDHRHRPFTGDSGGIAKICGGRCLRRDPPPLIIRARCAILTSVHGQVTSSRALHSAQRPSGRRLCWDRIRPNPPFCSATNRAAGSIGSGSSAAGESGDIGAGVSAEYAVWVMTRLSRISAISAGTTVSALRPSSIARVGVDSEGSGFEARRAWARARTPRHTLTCRCRGQRPHSPRHDPA